MSTIVFSIVRTRVQLFLYSFNSLYHVLIILFVNNFTFLCYTSNT